MVIAHFFPLIPENLSRLAGEMSVHPLFTGVSDLALKLLNSISKQKKRGVAPSEPDNTKGAVMEINQNINPQRPGIDMSQFASNPPVPGNRGAAAKEAGNEAAQDTPVDAATVQLSDEGRAASLTLDFNDTGDILSKLETLGKSDAFGKAHASFSYEKIKHLL